MQVTLAGFHTIMMRHAGPTTHILQIKEHLEKLGHEITLMDMWKTQREIFTGAQGDDNRTPCCC